MDKPSAYMLFVYDYGRKRGMLDLIAMQNLATPVWEKMTEAEKQP